MEKSAARKFRKQFIGLLILISAVGTAYAQWSYEAIRNLHFHQKNGYIYSLTNEEFYVDIENVSPNDVSVYLNSIPEQVELVSVKKETYIPPLESTSSSYGTHIVVTVRFLKSGNYKLFSCDLQIKDNFFKIPFEPVHVYENVQLLKPSLSVSFVNKAYNGAEAKEMSVPVGTHIQYTVQVQFASAIQGVSWTIPENSLFEQVSEYEVPKITATEQQFEVFSRLRPVATFDWCPLSEGFQKLPEINIIATALNGSTCSLEFPVRTVHVTEAARNLSTTPLSATSDFAESYEAPDSDMTLNENEELSDDAIAEYCILLKKERHSIPHASHAYISRISFEKKHGLPSVGALASKPLLSVFICLVVLTFVLSTVCFGRRKYMFFLLFMGLFCFFTGVSIFYGLRVNRQHAVVSGGMLMSIPEKDNSTGMAIQKGSLIRIKKHSGNWLYVVSHDTYGWMQKEDVIFIE